MNILKKLLLSFGLRLILVTFILVSSGFLHSSSAFAFNVSEKSPEELLVTEGKNRSNVNGKPLLVIVSASWCGPCFELHENMKKFKTQTDAVFSEYEYVFIEDTFTTRIPYDYIGKQMTGYPSAFIYEPSTKSWTSLPPWTDYFLFLENLKAFNQNRNNFGEFIWNRFNADVQSGKHFGNDDKSFEIWAILDIISSSYSTDNVLKKMIEIKNLRKNHPEQFKFASEEDFNYLFNWIFKSIFGKEDADLNQMRTAFPEALSETDLKEDAYTIRQYYFEIVLGKILRKSGKKIAAQNCDLIRNEFITHLGELSKKSAASLMNKSFLICEELKFITQVSERPDFIKAINSISESDKKEMSSQIWNAYALLGEFALASPYVELDYNASLSRAGGMGEDAEGAKARVIESYNALRSSHLISKRNPNVQ